MDGTTRARYEKAKRYIKKVNGITHLRVPEPRIYTYSEVLGILVRRRRDEKLSETEENILHNLDSEGTAGYSGVYNIIAERDFDRPVRTWAHELQHFVDEKFHHMDDLTTELRAYIVSSPLDKNENKRAGAKLFRAFCEYSKKHPDELINSTALLKTHIGGILADIHQQQLRKEISHIKKDFASCNADIRKVLDSSISSRNEKEAAKELGELIKEWETALLKCEPWRFTKEDLAKRMCPHLTSMWSDLMPNEVASGACKRICDIADYLFDVIESLDELRNDQSRCKRDADFRVRKDAQRVGSGLVDWSGLAEVLSYPFVLNKNRRVIKRIMGLLYYINKKHQSRTTEILLRAYCGLEKLERPKVPRNWDEDKEWDEVRHLQILRDGFPQKTAELGDYNPASLQKRAIECLERIAKQDYKSFYLNR